MCTVPRFNSLHERMGLAEEKVTFCTTQSTTHFYMRTYSGVTVFPTGLVVHDAWNRFQTELRFLLGFTQAYGRDRAYYTGRYKWLQGAEYSVLSVHLHHK